MSDNQIWNMSESSVMPTSAFSRNVKIALHMKQCDFIINSSSQSIHSPCIMNIIINVIFQYWNNKVKIKYYNDMDK